MDIYGSNDQPTHLGMRNFIYQTNMESNELLIFDLININA